jgi:hypothetical protein
MSLGSLAMLGKALFIGSKPCRSTTISHMEFFLGVLRARDGSTSYFVARNVQSPLLRKIVPMRFEMDTANFSIRDEASHHSIEVYRAQENAHSTHD